MIQRFVRELRRRKVLRVAGAYAVVGWGVLQMADALFPAFSLPEWTVTFVALLLLLGLPISMVIAWAFQWTPDGVRLSVALDDASDASADLPRDFWVDGGLLIAVVLVVVLAALQMGGDGDASGASVAAVQGAPGTTATVAVLPFASFSDDTQDSYFADGLTEELINGLAQVSGLRVPGRTSSFFFKNRNEDLREIARQLGVEHVLEGSVRRAGERLRVTVQLIAAADGFHLWSRTYDRDLDDVFAIQQDIATHVTAHLKQTLLSADHVDHVDEGLQSETYPRFLIATALLHDRTQDSLAQARTLFEEIMAREPDHVDALAGYARATMMLAGAYLSIEFEPAAAAAVSAVERALILAPDSVAANLAAGSVYESLAYRTDEQHYLALAERSLARAMNLAPHDPEVLRAYGTLLRHLGRWEAALAVTRRAVEHDPLDRTARLQLAETLRGLGRFDDARAEMEALIARHSDYVPAHLELGELLMEAGDLAGAIPHLERAHRTRSSPRATFALTNAYLNLGLTRAGQATLEELDYSPLSQPLGAMILQMVGGDDAAALAFAEGELARTGDRLWQPLVALMALMTGDLSKARAHIQKLQPALLAPEPDISRLPPTAVLLAANLLLREGHERDGEWLLRRLLERLTPAVGAHDPVASKVARAQARAQLGEVDGALAELAAARAQGYRTLIDFDHFLRIDRYPGFAGLRGDPRLQALLGAIERDNRAAGARVQPRLASS